MDKENSKIVKKEPFKFYGRVKRSTKIFLLVILFSALNIIDISWDHFMNIGKIYPEIYKSNFFFYFFCVYVWEKPLLVLVKVFAFGYFLFILLLLLLDALINNEEALEKLKFIYNYIIK